MIPDKNSVGKVLSTKYGTIQRRPSTNIISALIYFISVTLSSVFVFYITFFRIPTLTVTPFH